LSDTLILPPAPSDYPLEENFLPPVSSDYPLKEDLFDENLRFFGLDPSIFHGSIPKATVDNILYPSHSSLFQVFLNTGLSFLCLLGILWMVLLSRIILLIQNARIFWNVASSWCWSTIPIQVFFGTVLFWDTCLAIGSILIAPPYALASNSPTVPQ